MTGERDRMIIDPYASISEIKQIYLQSSASEYLRMLLCLVLVYFVICHFLCNGIRILCSNANREQRKGLLLAVWNIQSYSKSKQLFLAN